MSRSRCFAPVRGRMMRATRLDGCGRPIYGDESVAISKGFVSVAFTANNEEGEAVNVTNANGESIVNEPAQTRFQNYTAEIQFAQVDPAVFSMLTGQDAIYDPVSGEAIGFSVNSDVNPGDSGFALEVWTGVPAVGCSEDEASQGSFGYMLAPYFQGGTFGDFTIENGAVTFSVTGAQTRTGTPWGAGPYNVQLVDGIPSPLSTPLLAADHLRVQVVEIAPPTERCGLVPLLDPSGPAVSSLETEVDGFEVAITPGGSPEGDPMWYEFGDGTWDYAPDGEYVHTYASEGVYTIIGYRGTSSATVTVSVPQGDGGGGDDG